MDNTLRPYTVNLINSVIGVSILAMPFCFYKCGYILGILLLGFVAYITHLSSCQLLQLANFHKKRSYEFLALHVFGFPGKLVVELCIIGLIMGTFVAFYVIIGDLGPEIAKHVFAIETSPKMRAVFLIFLAVCVVLPLSMQKNIESLSNVSAVSLLFYSVFLLHIIWLAIRRTFSTETLPPMIRWNVSGIFQCMPIMSMAFGLQTQLFIVYDALAEPTMASMKTVVKTTLGFVAAVYIGVGFCGYYAFSSHLTLPGDILTLYPNTMTVNFLKMGFVFTVAISYPLLIFPVRASIYSLLFLQKVSTDLSSEPSVLMPERRFRAITLFVVFSTLICGILVPNVEFVLALTGSVTGSIMFFILPAAMYLKTFGTDSSLLPSKSNASFSSQTTSHRRLRIHPYIVLFTGVCVLIVGSMIAVEDQQMRLEELKKSAALAEARALKSGKGDTVGSRKVDNTKDLKAKKGMKRENGSKEIITRHRKKKAFIKVKSVGLGVAGLEERKEPPNPDKPAVKVFVNASMLKSSEPEKHKTVKRDVKRSVPEAHKVRHASEKRESTDNTTTKPSNLPSTTLETTKPRPPT